MKQSELRQLIREEIRKIISESSKNKNRKHTFENLITQVLEGKDPKELIGESSLIESVSYSVAKKLLLNIYNQAKVVKDSDYNIKEINKLDDLEREAVSLGLAKGLGSAWYKSRTPKELHATYKKLGYEWYPE